MRNPSLFASLSANMYPKNKRTACVALSWEIQKLTNKQCLLSVWKKKRKGKKKTQAYLDSIFFCHTVGKAVSDRDGEPVSCSLPTPQFCWKEFQSRARTPQAAGDIWFIHDGILGLEFWQVHGSSVTQCDLQQSFESAQHTGCSTYGQLWPETVNRLGTCKLYIDVDKWQTHNTIHNQVSAGHS